MVRGGSEVAPCSRRTNAQQVGRGTAQFARRGYNAECSLLSISLIAVRRRCVDWKRVEIPEIQPLLGSGLTYLLPTTGWPTWARRSTQFERVWAYCPGGSAGLASTYTTATVVARLLTERFDRKDERPYNHNYHLLVQTTDGAFYQSPPLRTTDIDHHTSAPLQLVGFSPRASR